MTANEKKRITDMRYRKASYADIASALDVPISTIKTFCHRNGLNILILIYFEADVYLSFCRAAKKRRWLSFQSIIFSRGYSSSAICLTK